MTMRLPILLWTRALLAPAVLPAVAASASADPFADVARAANLVREDG